MRRSLRFTIIELMVVIGIILILVSILLPALRLAKESGKSIACAGNLKQLGLGMHMYAEDFNRRLPDYPGVAWKSWDYKLAPYVNYTITAHFEGNPAIYHCPSGKQSPNALNIGGSQGYCYNEYVATDTTAAPHPSNSNGRIDENNKWNSSQMLLTECWRGASHDYVEAYVGAATLSYAKHGHTDKYAWRHNGKMNFLRKDGSVSSTKMGVSLSGEKIVWLLYDDGGAYRDGTIIY